MTALALACAAGGGGVVSLLGGPRRGWRSGEDGAAASGRDPERPPRLRSRRRSPSDARRDRASVPARGRRVVRRRRAALCRRGRRLRRAARRGSAPRARSRAGAAVRPGDRRGGGHLRPTADPPSDQGRSRGSDGRRCSTPRSGGSRRRTGRVRRGDADAGAADRRRGSRRGSPGCRGERSPWLSLLPVHAAAWWRRGSRPRSAGGDRIAAVLRVRAEWAAEGGRAAVRGRSGSPGSCGAGCGRRPRGWTADARALLPGLVVGDTSRVTPELDEAFKATDLTHLLAVSGAQLHDPAGPAHRAARSCPAGRAPWARTAAGHPAAGDRPARRRAHARLRDRVPAGPERAAGRGLRIDRAAGHRDRAPQIADPGAGHGRPAAGAVRPLAGPELRLPALRPGHRRPAHAGPAVECGTAEAQVCRRDWPRHSPPPAPRRRCARRSSRSSSARVSLVAVPCNLLAEFAVAPATVLGFATLADGAGGDAGRQGAGVVRELARRMDRGHRPCGGRAARRRSGLARGAGRAALLLAAGHVRSWCSSAVRLLRHPWFMRCLRCAAPAGRGAAARRSPG